MVGLASVPARSWLKEGHFCVKWQRSRPQEKSCSRLVSDYYRDADAPSFQPPLQLGMSM